MSYKSQTFDDEPVTRSRRAPLWEEEDGRWPRAEKTQPDEGGEDLAVEAASGSQPQAQAKPAARGPALRRGHAVSFAGLLLFTAVVYFRPYELVPALSGLTSMAFWIAVATLLVFIPTQLAVEGTLTARPREVNLALLLLLAGLLSVPLAIEPAEAWWAFLDFAKVITMFVVMINVVRTEMRWRLMVWLALVVSVVLSAHAVTDYLAGNLALNGMRIEGAIGGLFDNPNDLALHLVTMIPLALGLLFVARAPGKVVYGLCALLMMAAVVVTFSRGGFLGLACALFVLAWKLGPGKRLRVLLIFAAAGILFFAFVPSEYVGRLLTSFGGDADGGSAISRQNLLWRSLEVSVRHPLLGIGMNNFHIVSIREQVSHNAYTQVSAEMGLAALVVYIMFIWSSLKRLREVERATREARKSARVYYLAVGLQASLVGFMVSSFFASVAYLWYIYYLAGYALCLHRLYEAAGPEGAFGRAPAGRRPAAAAGPQVSDAVTGAELQ
ncbi:MAG TPA: O-antigen ligase family protein [Pyrinomonadaceae bacterium]|nr:O-antigen ligase family protein [Pyrinomonadaceae bacterium]